MPILSNKGLTLIEVLVALAVMAVAFVAVLKSDMLAQDTKIDARRTTLSTLLARDVMTRIEAKGIEEWYQYEGDFGRDYPDFSWEAEIDESMSRQGLYGVTVKVLDRDEERVITRMEAIVSSREYSVELEE